MEKKYFGTDGIRGQVGNSLINAEFMLKLGWAVGKVLANSQPATVLVGKDTRISGYMIESALQAGLSAAGVNIKLTGPMPTPALAYLTRSVRADAGIVISASHNSYPDNGIKFFNRDGFKLSDELELIIEKQIDKPMRTVQAARLGKAARMSEAYGRYIEFCKNTLFPSQFSLKGLKLVVDCANGATYFVAPAIFHELGATSISINIEPNGFNINQSCGAIDTRKLQKSVIQHKADVGIAFDGDGDRLIMVDHQGIKVDGDELLCIIAINYAHLKKDRPLGVVGTVMSNLGLEQTLKQHNIVFERSSVGDRYVLELMQQRGWLLGGESSGHIVDLEFTTTGDGIITALQILRIMQQTGKPLAELKRIMVKRPQTLVNVPIDKVLDVKRYLIIKNAVAKVEKQFNSTGRVLLRPSGTEPVIRVMVEGNDEIIVRQTAARLAVLVGESLQ
ncbi:phosphoglucosamine mutase [Coxiella endosymbiont of Amblyomma nuttalli]|uniref:phosphoglucosamine mutase n=1 Tax=Coxiella endosymbiont of Amblyomma nuttalli TaxID=2749996 RepID=UPI001BAAE0E4|nr:phosphoglucosamine mutase [Coxiella endosymbiont of Amblyomma nuttalli]QTS83860.1 Phosphoglucosamine mutase [Coxiella endosymbiont of Amblyomma nuttalli]